MDADTPLQGLKAMDQSQEIRIHQRPLKQLRLWGLVAFGLMLVLREADRQCGGVIFTWIGSALSWTMEHPIFPGAIGVLLGHYCWPQTVRIMPGRKTKDE